MHLLCVGFLLATILAGAQLIFRLVQLLLTQDLADFASLNVRGLSSLQSFLQEVSEDKWGYCAIFGSFPFTEVILVFISYKMVKHMLEGKFTLDVAETRHFQPDELVAPDIEGSAKGSAGLSVWQRLRLYVLVQHDMLNSVVGTLVVLHMVPVVLAVWSLMLDKGASFQYVVAAKPSEGKQKTSTRGEETMTMGQKLTTTVELD